MEVRKGATANISLVVVAILGGLAAWWWMNSPEVEVVPPPTPKPVEEEYTPPEGYQYPVPPDMVVEISKPETGPHMGEVCCPPKEGWPKPSYYPGVPPAAIASPPPGQFRPPGY